MRKGVLRPESFHERTFCRAFFKKTAEIHIMSIESYPEAQAASESYLQQPPARKGSGGVRIVIYVVLVAFVALVVWKIYQTQQTAKSQASSAAAALAGRAVPVQVGGGRAADAHLPDGAGHGDSLHERDREGARQRRAGAGEVH